MNDFWICDVYSINYGDNTSGFEVVLKMAICCVGVAVSSVGCAVGGPLSIDTQAL